MKDVINDDRCKIQNDNIRNEKGSITIFVLLSMIFFVIILSGVYIASLNKQKASLNYVEKIANNYDADADEVYDNWINEKANAEIKIANYSIGESYYETLKDAINAAENGQTIKVEAENLTDDSEAKNSKNITLNLNGKTLTTTNSIENSGTLTITGNGTLTTSAEIDLITNTGTLKLSQTGTISNTNTSHYTINNSANGNVTKDETGTISSSGYNAISNNGKLNISNGTISGIQTGIVNNETGTISITGGIITGTNSNGIINSSANDITVSKCIVTGKENGISNSSAGNVTIESGSITGTTGNGINNTSTGNITVSGGTVTGQGNGINNNSTGSITITDGTVIGQKAIGVYNGSTGVITVGTKDTTINTTSPVISGSYFGVNNMSGSLNFYDGVISGQCNSNVPSYRAIYGDISDKPDGYGAYNLVSNGIESASLKQGLILNYDGKYYSTVTTGSSTNSSWYDRSGNGNSGSLKNFSYTTSSGWSSYNQHSNGLVFDGSDDWVNTGIIDTSNIAERTYSITFKASAISANQYLIGNWESGRRRYLFYFY